MSAIYEFDDLGGCAVERNPSLLSGERLPVDVHTIEDQRVRDVLGEALPAATVAERDDVAEAPAVGAELHFSIRQ